MVLSIVAAVLALVAPSAPVPSVGERASELIDITLPAEWKRSEKAGLLRFTHAPTDEMGLKVVFALSSQPKTGSMSHTFLGLWTSAIHGMFPNEPLTHKMVPLVIRNSKGTVVAFDGDALEKNNFRVMLYLVDCGDSVVPIIGMFKSDPPIAAISFVSSNGPSDMAKAMTGMVDSITLKKGQSTPGSIFKASDLVGSYTRTTIASSATYVNRNTGARVGDASSGLSQDFTFHSDGTYEDMSVVVANGRAGDVSHRKATWKLVGDKVVIHYADEKTPDTSLWLMGLGLGRRGDRQLAYLVDPRYLDKYFGQMFVEGADVSYFYAVRKSQ